MSKHRILVPTAAAVLLAAPAAQARPPIDPATHDSPAPALTAAPRVQASDGFDWGSAAIGAGSVAGLLALFSAGAAVGGRRVRLLPTR